MRHIRHAQRHAPRHAQRHAPRHAQRNAPRHAQRHAPRHAQRHAPRHAQRHAPRHAQRRSRVGHLFLLGLLLSGCQTFVEVTTQGNSPVFNWRADAPVTGLMVVADEDCELPGGAKSFGDRIFWHVQGEMKPPVTYGKVPPGATETARARPFLKDCKWYTVTLTDQTMQGESSKFRW